MPIRAPCTRKSQRWQIFAASGFSCPPPVRGFRQRTNDLSNIFRRWYDGDEVAQCIASPHLLFTLVRAWSCVYAALVPLHPARLLPAQVRVAILESMIVTYDRMAS